ncbi:WD40 repeat domain-containing serine/threonine protein kinase [Actinomadura sp. 1N219]|uniref:WD40 repeat domain-containing serine/threonine protein kinase n=1 Tax=Actinomadura sp. 1N219 TaxID=3375152 RepID=UPI0037AC2D5C
MIDNVAPKAEPGRALLEAFAIWRDWAGSVWLSAGMTAPGSLVAGRYRLLGLLGEGGMGAAWRARDERLSREVAVKHLKVPSDIGAKAVALLVSRMHREARAAAALRHQGIVTVHDLVDDEDGLPWIVMDLVSGCSLEQAVKNDGPLTMERAARIGAQVADALAAAHAAGIVHRDIKPANILLEADQALVTDFGIAAVDGAARITHSGMLLGTPAYMPPEQLEGRQATPASDVWSLGATLYFALEGRHAFVGFRRDRPAPMSQVGGLQDVINDLMCETPSGRPTAAQAAKSLRQEPATATRPDLTHGSNGPFPALARDHPIRIGHLSGHATPVTTVAFSPDGRTLATGSGDKTVRLWDVRSRSQIGQPLTDGYPIHAVAFSPDGATLATGGLGNKARLWDVPHRSQIGQPLGHKGKFGSVDAVAFSPDGRTLATGGSDKTVRLWDVENHSQVGQPSGMSLIRDEARVLAVAFSPDGKTLATAGNDTRVRLWDAGNCRQIGQPLLHKGRSNAVLAVVFSPDGRTLVTAGSDTRVRLWDVGSRYEVGQLSGHKKRVVSVVFSPDGRRLATGGDDGTVRLWDVGSRSEVGQLTGHKKRVVSVAFSPDGKSLATVGLNGTVQLWTP